MTFELPVLLCTDPFLPGTGEESEVHSKDWDVRSWLVLFLLICLFFSKYPQNNDEKEKKLNQWEKENKQRSNRCALCSFRAIIVSSMTTSNRVANTLESFRSTRLTWQYTQQHRRNRADRKNRNSTARSLAHTPKSTIIEWHDKNERIVSLFDDSSRFLFRSWSKTTTGATNTVHCMSMTWFMKEFTLKIAEEHHQHMVLIEFVDILFVHAEFVRRFRVSLEQHDALKYGCIA